MITQLADVASRIPEFVWSALLACIATLLGAMVSNRASAKQNSLQLEHSAKESEKDRIGAVRKDVYLKAAEEASRAGAYLGRIPLLDPVENNVADGLGELFAVLAKVQLVSSNETAGLAGEFVALFGEALLDMTSIAMPIHGLNTEIRITGGMVDRHQDEIDRILAEMKQFNESNQTDGERFDALSRSLKSSQSLLQLFSDRREKAFEERDREMNRYTRALVATTAVLGRHQIKLAVAIRGELNLDSDIREFEARLEMNLERAEKRMSRFLKEMKGA